MQYDIPEPKSDLAKLYRQQRNLIISQTPQLSTFNETEADVLSHIAEIAPDSKAAKAYQRLVTLMGEKDVLSDDSKKNAFATSYRNAMVIAMPATAAYLNQQNEMSGLTQDYSLTQIDLNMLREIDRRAYHDDDMKTFVSQMCAKFDEISSPPDAQRYGQVFEIYAEAIVLARLRDCKVVVRKIPEGKKSSPDFECETKDGKTFFIEVKAFNIVDGTHRHKEMMLDALDTEVEIERQLRDGKQIAMVENEIAPYRKVGSDVRYDPRSVKMPIDRLRNKFQQAFKSSQFKDGPTFALAVADRLIIPGGPYSLAPYYYDDFQSGSCVSGIIWQAAYGHEGGAIMRSPEFEGKSGYEGVLDAPGLFVDQTNQFPARGLIVFYRETGGRVAYGLAGPEIEQSGWTSDDTEAVLHTFTDAWNDLGNTRYFELAETVEKVRVKKMGLQHSDRK